MEHFNEIKGYKGIKKELEYALDSLLNFQDYKKLGVTAPQGILLWGDPGVGKTLMANCFIAASKRKTFVCKKKSTGAAFTEQIKRLFEEAKANAPSVVLLDDVDKFANATAFRGYADEYSILQSCIDDLKESEVFVIATANDLMELPQSLLRCGRFDRIIYVPKPRGKDAEEIVEHYLRQKQHVDDMDSAFIARLLSGRSCADLETVINKAGIRAGFYKKEKIEMDDIVDACLENFFLASEYNEFNDSELEKVAYHEAGHAVIGEILEPGSTNLISVRTTSEGGGGISSVNKDENFFRRKDLMENRIIMTLGGKAATEIIYGEVDMGVNKDLEEAFEIAVNITYNYCANGFDKWGNDSIRSTREQRNDEEVRVAMEKYYSVAKKILIKNRAFLEKVANVLVEKHTVIGKEIREIKERCAISSVGISI